MHRYPFQLHCRDSGCLDVSAAANLVLQLRKARDFQRLAEQESEGQAGGAAGYRGPDGSGQWVSMGELGSNDLDQVLGGLGGGKLHSC